MRISRRARHRHYRVRFDVVFRGHLRQKCEISVSAPNKQRAEMAAEEWVEDNFPRDKWPPAQFSKGKLRPLIENLTVTPRKLA